jgi:hypothetical protein
MTDSAVATRPDSPLVNKDNPWPGLLAFQEVDQEYFHGRAPETESLFRMVMRERLTVMFGLSGLGKSSLLQAGLFPRLRAAGLFPVYVRLDFSADADLTAQVLTVIGKAAKSADVEAPAALPGESLWEYFHRQDADFWNNRNRPVVPVLAFDQFEEVFTLGRSSERVSAATAALLDQLTDLAEGRPSARLKAQFDQNPEAAKEFVFSSHRYKILLSIR